MAIKYRVVMIESEAGWGQRVDDVLDFDTETEARTYETNYNAKYNPPGPTPAWYIVASYSGPVSV